MRSFSPLLANLRYTGLMANKYRVLVPQIGIPVGDVITAKQLHPNSSVEVLLEIGHLERVSEDKPQTSAKG